jgi:hypothetical protein
MRLFGRPVALVQLRDELVTAGISVGALGTNGDDLHTYDGATPIDLPPGARAVIDAHVPAPPPPLPNYNNEDTTREQLANAVDNLRAYLALASPTNAQTIAAFKLLIRVVLFLCKQVVR